MIGKPLKIPPNINARSASGSVFVTIRLNVDAIESQPKEEEKDIHAPVTYRRKINVKSVEKFPICEEDNTDQ